MHLLLNLWHNGFQWSFPVPSFLVRSGLDCHDHVEALHNKNKIPRLVEAILSTVVSYVLHEFTCHIEVKVLVHDIVVNTEMIMFSLLF